MAIPPFPSQDLAKLVLGYLAEEQLMTAYDEFLQASPYLDAMRNEYDRIFMTSLKSILAEYRAVKIYVETCKPFLLRKKLIQCVNLFEIVKFLVNNVDVDKLCTQDFGEKSSMEKHSFSFRSVGCDVCNSLNLTKCVCKEKQNRRNTGNAESVSHSEKSFLQSSIETTSLTDLPGNNLTVVKKKHAKTIEKKIKQTRQNSGNIDEIDLNTTQAINAGGITNCSTQQFLAKSNNVTAHEQSSTLCYTNVQPTCVIRSVGTTSESSNANLAKNNVGIGSRNMSTLENKTISSSFQDFASGVRGCENVNAIVPDSSTSDNTHLQTIAMNNGNNYQREIQIGLKKDPVNKMLLPQGNGNVPTVSTSYGQMKPKTHEQRIKILSDVKVDNSYSNERKLIPTSRNATSTPLMQMQTIVINGTASYKPQPSIHAQQQNFTRDEIMAMPTIIVVPASGPPQLTSSQTGPVSSLNTNRASVQSVPARKVLSPLVIDVSPGTSEEKGENKQSSDVQVIGKDTGLIKTVDNNEQHKMTSLPKNNNMTCSTETTTTPLVMPPLRKSSSTPRRTSHVRVLDFTTPRRILHETIMEQGGIQVNDKSDDVIVSKSNNIVISERPELSVCENVQKLSVPKLVSIPTKDNVGTVLSTKKINWDHDLRAMIANDDLAPKVKSKPRLKSTKKKKMSLKNCTDKDDKDDKNDVSEKKTRARKSKKRQILEDDDEVSNLPTKPDSVPVKPTINIKPAVEWEPSSVSGTKKEVETSQIKNTEDEHIETPEVDHIALQNVIGSKLNISDLLETPYKQVFYDIQMGTPRFFGPDVAGEPMSDIKIMSIPTPRFFNSPKITQATPSSYCSRPTDYSSGGSYYKPDDQDYLPIPDIRCPVTSSKEESNVEVSKDEIIDKRTARPVRQCAKNVSYYASNKVKDGDDKTDVASTSSETTNANSSLEIRVPKDKSVKGDKAYESIKPERTKRSGRKKKSPKEKPKTFMKIKPRRVTPIKETLSGKSRRKTLQSNSPKLQRKRTTSKDKNSNNTPLATSIPTKSRRKSSTPRKLNCSKTFNSESSGHNSPEISTHSKQQNTTRDTNSINTLDSDTEQINLRWSDDGSQDLKSHDTHKNVSESEDISKIQEYIKTTVVEEPTEETINRPKTPLVEKGFDEVTAKNIERDLSDTPPRNEFKNTVQQQVTDSKEITKDVPMLDKTIEIETSTAKELQIVQDSSVADDGDEIELSVHDTNEETGNWQFLTFTDGDVEGVCKQPSSRLKDTFSMEVCIEDGIAIRLRATPFNSVFELESTEDDQPYCDREIEEAVKSISNIDKLYTPLKDSIKAQCYEIFDSTLTSLDTPLKATSPKKIEREITVTEITLEIEKSENKDKIESKKRKRLQNSNGSEELSNENKKPKPDTQYLLATANIQNIDIESVLKKLHGP